MKTKEQLREQMQTSLKVAKDIAAKADAEGRDLTAAENEKAAAALRDFKSAKTEFEAARVADTEQMKAALAEIGVDLGLGDRPAGGYKIERTSRGKAWAQNAVKALDGLRAAAGAPDGAKALLSGSISLPNLLDQGRPITIDTPSTTLLDLIGRGEPSGERIGNEFMYIRQTTRTNNAAPVADGAAKPTSVYTFGEVNDRYRYFVNKTEDLPYRYLADYPTLTDAVQQQLAEDTILAIDEDVLSGDGTGEHFTGLLNVSGTQQQAWTTDFLTTLTKAKYKLIAQELPFNGWVFHPDDLQALELMRENGSTGAFLFKSHAEIAAFLGAPFAITTGMPLGTAMVGNYQDAELIPLGDDELVIDTAKRTVNNTFLMMFEGRYGFRIKKPISFVEVDLTSA